MSYSVNFSENADKIVLGNVVMNGNIYTPSAVTEVFTKDATGLLSKQPIDLTKITYAHVGTAGPTGVPAGVPGTGVTVPTEPVAPTAQEEALQKAQIAISIAISSARTYKDAKFLSPPNTGGAPLATADEAIAKVGTAITEVDAAIVAPDTAIKTKYEDANKKLQAINTALTVLKTVLNNFNAATTAPSTEPSTEPNKDNLEAAIEKVKTTHNDLFTSNQITGGAPLRFGSSSSKTKRNRRKNKRFVKKSYKRRR